ncbi:MAG: hypothetical protein E7392_02965 [Ruminococcaceae bacterium]|nr:hypothetical protein [Oscillospiraceae bacterium]
MCEVKKERAISASGAQGRESIDAENNAMLSTSQTGENKSFDAESKRDKEAEFDALIENEYKEQFSKKVQKIISRRLKEVKTMKEASDKNEQLVSSLMKKFNIEDGDTEKLERMIDSKMTQKNDNMQEKTAQLLRRLVAENNYLKKSREEDIRRIEMQNRAQILRNQAEETKKVYPEFDFEAQLKNPEFCRLLKVGVSVKNAYEVANIDSILDNNSKNAEKMVVDSIRTKGNRPIENGSDSSGGIILSTNVSKLTKKQRAELAKRAAKGEMIKF